MKHGRIIRSLSLPEHGTYGVFVLDAQPFCVTLEPYHRYYNESISCIHAGQYIGIPHNSFIYGPVYLLVDNSGKEMTELHPAVADEDPRGAIILAQHYGKLIGNYQRSNTGRTFKKFLDIMNGKKLFLTIIDAF